MSTQIAQDLDKMLDSLEQARNVIDRRMNVLRIARDAFVTDGVSSKGQVKAHKRGRGSGSGGPILAVARKRFRGGQITPDSLSEAAGIQARHAMVWLGQQLRRGNLTRVRRGVYRLSGGGK